MAIASIGVLGTGNGSITGGVSSTSFDLSNPLVAGRVVIVAVTCDNNATTDGEHSDITSVTDLGGVSWTKIGEYTNGEGAANTGLTTGIFYRPRQATDLPAVGDDITVTLSHNVADACYRFWEFSVDYDLVLISSTPNATDASNGFGSASISSLPSRRYLFFRALGKEANVASTQNITVSSGFTDFGNVRSRNNAAAVCLRGEFKIGISTGETSNPTFAFSGDTSALFVALAEYITGAVAFSGAATAAFAGSVSKVGAWAGSGAATASFAATVTKAGAVSYSATGTAAWNGEVTTGGQAGEVAFAGTGTAAFAALVSKVGALAAAGSGTAAFAATVTKVGAWSGAGASTASFVATVGKVGALSCATTATVDFAATLSRSGAVSFAATATVTFSGSVAVIDLDDPVVRMTPVAAPAFRLTPVADAAFRMTPVAAPAFRLTPVDPDS